MRKQVKNNRKHSSTALSLLIAAHCSTIRRKTINIDTKELSAILDDFVRELNSNTLDSKAYLNSLNEIIKSLNSTSPPSLIELSSHYFFIISRNTIRNLLQQFNKYNRLTLPEIYLLRNCILLIYSLVKKVPNVSKILHWITDSTFLDALANCLNHIDEISKKSENKLVIKQITRLLNIFCNVQQRLPVHLHHSLFVRLLQPTINCLISSKYVQLFADLKANANSLTPTQKLFLVKCPYFLTTYNGPHIKKAIEQILEIMLPRCVSILDKHIKKIKEWKRPMMRAIHNLIITIVFAEGYFSLYTNHQSFRLLIDHLLRLLNEPILINKIRQNSNNMETLLIDATLVVFSVLVYEPNALDYIKQRKPVGIFRKLTTAPYEPIVLNAYRMLVYTMEENDIKTLEGDLSKLLFTTLNLLQKAIKTRYQTNEDETFNREHIDRNIMQLIETLKGLAQYEQGRNEILKQGALSLLIEYYEKLNGLSKQLILRCLWTLSFNEQIAQQLRAHQQFILSLENIPKTVNDNTQQNTIRRSNSHSGRRNSAVIAYDEASNNGIQKVANGLIWKLVKEPQLREKFSEKIRKQAETNVVSDKQKYKYDMMISYSYADKEIVHKIKQFLTNEGFNIWSDRNNIHEQAMETVAEAIENSQFTIICMSDSYKRDNHCQAEAEYAVNCKRLLLPLIVHKGYKPDGWLSSVTSNSTYIDFGISDFKTSATLLMNEIKQQRKKEILNVKPITSTPVTVVHTSFVQPTASHKPYVPAGSSTSVGATTGSGLYSSTSIAKDRQQQQQIPARPISRSPLPSSTSVDTSIVTDKQQQTAIYPLSRQTIPDLVPSITPVLGNKQQQLTPVPPVLEPMISGPIPSVTSVVGNRQQQETPLHSSSRPTISDPILPATSVANDKQEQQVSERPVSRPTISDFTPSVTSTNVYREQQIPIRATARSPTPSSISSETFTVTDDEEQIAVGPIPRSTIPGPVSPAVFTVANQQQQQTQVRPVSRPTIPSPISSTTSVLIGKQQQRVPTPSFIPSAASTLVDRQQQQIAVRSISRTVTPSFTSFDTSAVTDRQQQAPVHPVSRPPMSSPFPPSTLIVVNRQQQQMSMNPVSRSTVPGSVLPATYVAVDRHQQQQGISEGSNLRPTTPSALSVVPSVNPELSASSLVKVVDEARLLEEYTNRKTANSTYRSISINAWGRNDILDFLFDSNLYAMMPLCESMSGKALVRLFRMCQGKPTRLHGQLNDELRARFNGLTLPMGVYTQFLIIMDNLVGPAPETILPILPPKPKIIERIILMPSTTPQQPLPTQSSSRSGTPATILPSRSKTVTPVEAISRTQTPSSRIIERADFRPPSRAGRAYNFIVESVEESTAILEKVEHFGPQLLLLDERARQHHAMNGSR